MEELLEAFSSAGSRLHWLQPHQRWLQDLRPPLQYSYVVHSASLGVDDVSTLRALSYIQAIRFTQAHALSPPRPVSSLFLSQHQPHLSGYLTEGKACWLFEDTRYDRPSRQVTPSLRTELLMFISVWETHTHHHHGEMMHPDVLGSLGHLELACLFCHP